MKKLIELLTNKMNNSDEAIAEILTTTWENIPFDLAKNPKKYRRGQLIKTIRKQIVEDRNKPKKGVYVVYDEDNKKNKFLYIGKTAILSNAIQRHYNDAYNIGKNVSKNYYDFFRKYKKQLTIYFKKIDNNNDEKKGEALRIIIERLLTVTILPQFEIEHPTIK